ncbi:MAG: cation:proton antiporter [Cyanobacteriota bacterium]
MGSSLLSILLLLMVGVLAARITAGRLSRWAVPAIVLELLVGFAIGNSLLPFDRLQPLSGLMELGVLSLFFMVGLEVRDGLRRSRGAAVVRTVLLSALTPLLASWPLQQIFGLSAGTTLLCVAMLSATGTGVTLRTLAQAEALGTPSGQLLVGVSVLDDLPAIALLSAAMMLGLGDGSEALVGLGSGHLPLPIGLPLGLLLGAISLRVSRWWHQRHGPWTPGALGILLMLIGSSWLGEVTGLTSLLGALWGGVLVSRLTTATETPTAASRSGGDATQAMQRHLSLAWEVFLPLYFIGVGQRIDATTLRDPQAWWLALVMIILGVICKLICGFGINRRDRIAGVDRWVVVFGLIPRGLPGLVFASTALEAGLISRTVFSSLVLMVTATTVIGLLLLGRRLQELHTTGSLHSAPGTLR